MRPRQALGRRGTAVIPARWQESHGAVAAKTMPASVALRKPGSTKTWNPISGQFDYATVDPYATAQAARIQTIRPTASAHLTQTGEESVQQAEYLITLVRCRDLADEPAAGDLVDVEYSDDQLLASRSFRVVSVPKGSLRFERDLYCHLVDQEDALP